MRPSGTVTRSGPGANIGGYGPCSSNLFWIDLETTSLDHNTAQILELFVLVTDHNLQAIDSLELVIHHSSQELEELKLSSWVTHNHSQLLQLVQQSPVTLQQAQAQLIQFLDRYRQGKACILAGSSVDFDRHVLWNQMPQTRRRVHYRVVDVSTLMELARRWCPNLHHHAPRHYSTHRARQDVYASLQLLSFYRQHLFQLPPYSL